MWYKSLKISALQIFLPLFIVGITTYMSYGQTKLNELDKSQYFDFWLGEWELSWEASDGSIEKGINTIERILGAKVIKESFEATSGSMKGFAGQSYSVFNENTGEWKQTWVDNNGAYLDFTGTFDGEKRIFVRSTKDRQGNTVLQRMVFHDIKENSFTWDWEQSTDNGKNWLLQWKIAYQRVQE